jgi:hypothetical protein
MICWFILHLLGKVLISVFRFGNFTQSEWYRFYNYFLLKNTDALSDRWEYSGVKDECIKQQPLREWLDFFHFKMLLGISKLYKCLLAGLSLWENECSKGG